METKKNYTIVIVILALLIVGLGGYIVYDKMAAEKTINTDNQQKSTENKEDKKCSSIEPLRLDSTEVDALEKVIYSGTIYEEGNNLFFSDKEVTYDEISEKLANNGSSHEITGPQTLHFIVSAYKEGNKYTAITKVIFPESYGKATYDMIFYADYARTKRLTNIYQDQNMGGNAPLTLENMRKGATYELTFTNNAGEYKFVSSKPINN